MAQTTNYEIENSSGLVFRGRVNEVFAAVQSSNSGATEPTGTVAYQLWYDTTTNILKMRDASDAAWISLFTVDQTNGVWSVNANSTSDALRITQTGTGNALLVEDSANPDSTPFVVTAAGNVGIGTTNPAVRLSIADAGNVNKIFLSGVSATNNTEQSSIKFSDLNNAVNSEISSYRGASFERGELTFKTAFGGVLDEHMRITSAGNVGIGTTVPTVKLDVVGTTNSTNLTRGGSQVYSYDNILATVSQTSGVPTGGIIERGSVSPTNRGQYIRYADGTQICWTYDAGSLDSTSAQGSVFRTTTESTWTFPVAFSQSPVVAGLTNTASRWIAIGAVQTTTVDFRQYTAVTATTTTPTRLMAVGRWF